MLTYSTANAILNVLTSRTSSWSNNSTYVGLSTTAPNRDGTGVTEPSSAAGYKRTLIGAYNQSSTQKMNNATNGASDNNDIIYFPEATGSWGTCTYFTLYTAQTGGTLIAYGALTNSISPTTGTVPIIRVGDLTMALQ